MKQTPSCLRFVLCVLVCFAVAMATPVEEDRKELLLLVQQLRTVATELETCLKERAAATGLDKEKVMVKEESRRDSDAHVPNTPHSRLLLDVLQEVDLAKRSKVRRNIRSLILMLSNMLQEHQARLTDCQTGQ